MLNVKPFSFIISNSLFFHLIRFDKVEEAVISIESSNNCFFASIHTVYTSLGKRSHLTSKIEGSLNWLDCKWTTVPAIIFRALKQFAYLIFPFLLYWVPSGFQNI